MMLAGVSGVEEMAPDAAFETLKTQANTALIDVRTKPEWAFTGLPDIATTGRPLWLIEWVTYPHMAPNDRFLDELVQEAGGDLPGHLLFLCRSGARSLAAAAAVAQSCAAQGVEIRCTNIMEGFEGDLDAERHRGTCNGWKGRGLPWVQS